MESDTQLSLFDPPTFSDLLDDRSLVPELSISANPRLKRGWKVAIVPESGKRRLIVPSYLLDAPEEVKRALIAWALLPLRPGGLRKKIVRQQRTLLEKTVWRYIESRPGAPRRASRFNAAAGRTIGRSYDLREVFDSVNAASFSAAIIAVVRWGSARSRTSYHTVKTDKHGARINLITIAGAYDRSDVPRFAIEAIMHHEMLHIAIPPYRKNGRMVVHGSEFKNAERKHTFYARWRKWEREYPAKIVRR